MSQDEVAPFVTRKSRASTRAHDSAIFELGMQRSLHWEAVKKNDTKAADSDFDGGEAESLDAAAVKGTLIRVDEVLPCRVLTSTVEKRV